MSVNKYSIEFIIPEKSRHGLNLANHNNSEKQEVNVFMLTPVQYHLSI